MGSSHFDFPQSRVYSFTVITLISYFLPFPLILWLTGSSGFAMKYIAPTIVGVISLGPFTTDSRGAQVPAAGNDTQGIIISLTMFYIIAVYIFSATMPVTAQLAGSNYGYRNKEPRLHKRQLGPGIFHRMVATHEALYDIFPAYAVTASLVAINGSATTPSPSPLQLSQTVGGLVFHVFCKLCIYTPAYIFAFDLVRSVSHMISVQALLVSLWSVLAIKSWPKE